MIFKQLFHVAFLCPVLRDREERLAALSAAQQEAMEELQKKIQMKVSYTVPPCIPIGHYREIPCFQYDPWFLVSSTA